MKRIRLAAWIVLFLAFLLVSCKAGISLTHPGETTAPLSGSVLPATPPPEPKPLAALPPLPPPGDDPVGPADHTHSWSLEQNRSATCAVAGLRVWKCSCGAEKREVLPLLPHSFLPADCTTPETCAVCGAVRGEKLGHDLAGTACRRCQQEFLQPIFVLNEGFDLGQSRESVVKTLGRPQETLNESGYLSLLYAADPSKLTVFQFLNDRLTGVFSFDPAVRFRIEENDYTLSSFSGERDLNSDARYIDTSLGCIDGFSEFSDNGLYALWFHQPLWDYDFINNARLYRDFSAQCRLSFYFVNALRAKAGLAPLIWCDAAASVAAEYCAYMEENDFFDHDHSYSARLTEKGISWSYAGENLSRGYFNAFYVCDAYYHSPSHRENLLHPDYTHVGMGYRRIAALPSVYGSQVFYR